MEKLLKVATTLLEKYAIPIVCLVACFLYFKYSSFINGLFGWGKDKEKEKAEMQEHDQALVLATKPVTSSMSKAEQARVTQQNAEQAHLFLAARAAEKLKGPLDSWNPMLPWTRKTELDAAAAYMKQHKISLKLVAKEYTKLTRMDMYEEARYTLGTEYMKWLGVAGTYP